MSDILRAALVLLVPVAVLVNVWLVYPLMFADHDDLDLLPARAARRILPRIVDEEDLLAANSAMWVGETLADVINYPIAGRVRRLPPVVARGRLLVRRGDLPRVGSPPRDDGRPPWSVGSRTAAAADEAGASRRSSTRARPGCSTT